MSKTVGKIINKIKINSHFNCYEFGIIRKLAKSSVICKILNVVKSKQDVPFVVLGHNT